MKKIYDIVVTTGEYTTASGETKKKYLTIGAVLEGDKGMSMKLETIPLGWEGWAAFYVPKERVQDDKQPSTKQKASVMNDPFEDDSSIPF